MFNVSFCFLTYADRIRNMSGFFFIRCVIPFEHNCMFILMFMMFIFAIYEVYGWNICDSIFIFGICPFFLVSGICDRMFGICPFIVSGICDYKPWIYLCLLLSKRMCVFGNLIPESKYLHVCLEKMPIVTLVISGVTVHVSSYVTTYVNGYAT